MDIKNTNKPTQALKTIKLENTIYYWVGKDDDIDYECMGDTQIIIDGKKAHCTMYNPDKTMLTELDGEMIGDIFYCNDTSGMRKLWANIYIFSEKDKMQMVNAAKRTGVRIFDPSDITYFA